MIINVDSITGKQFAKACALALRVEVLSPTLFEIPSATRPGVRYRVAFILEPDGLGVTCACAAGEQGKACHHAARALDVMKLLAVNDIHIAPQTESAPDFLATPTSESIDAAHLERVVRLASGVINAGGYADWEARDDAERALWGLVLGERATERRAA